MMKRFIILAIAVLMLLIPSCVASDPWPDDIYTKNIYPGDGNYEIGTASGNYTGEYAYSWTQTALLSGWGTCSFSHKIKGLTTGTKYYFRSRAYNGTSKITPSLGVSAGGQAIWSSVTSHSSPYSVRLTAPTSSDYARVQVPYVVDFGNFTAPSFWYSISDGSARTAENLGATWPIYVKYEATVDRGYLSPYFVIQIGNGVTDHWIISQPWASQTVKNKKWVEWSNSQRSNGYTEALWHDEVFTDPSLGGGIPAGWGPLSYFTNLYNSYNTTVVKVGFGNFDVVGKVMAYVDDISLAGNMIDLNKANTRIQRWGYGEEFSFTTP